MTSPQRYGPKRDSALRWLAAVAVLLFLANRYAPAAYDHFIETESDLYNVADLLAPTEGSVGGFASAEALVGHLRDQLGWRIVSPPSFELHGSSLIVRGRHYLLLRVQQELEALRDA